MPCIQKELQIKAPTRFAVGGNEKKSETFE